LGANGNNKMNTLYRDLLWIGLLAMLAGPLIPGVVAYVMSLNRRPLLAGVAFALGAAAIALLFSMLAIAILATTTTSGKAQYTLFIVMGLVLLFFGLKAWLTPPADEERAAAGRLQRLAEGGVGAVLLLGAITQIVNSDALIVLLPGLDAIASAGIGRAQQALAMGFLVAVLLLPVWLPVGATAIAPKPTMRRLSALGTWLRRHERAVNVLAGVGIGGLFLLRGVAGLR
jgi:cytochrome c biogenesis protein CcdA